MYTDIYTASLPPELLAMAETPVMQRLLRVGMHCGCEYTAYPIYRDAVAPYSRYTHSLGTAAIVWHFTHDLKQSVAGLLHDIATPAFAHVVDFLNGDHMRQESTESRTRMMIASSPELMALLDKSGLTLDDVDDYTTAIPSPTTIRPASPPTDSNIRSATRILSSTVQKQS